MSECISNVPERLDIRVKQGSTFSFQMEFYLADGETPRVLTGQAVQLRARKKRTSTNLLLTADATIGTNVGVDDHVATFVLPAADTADIPCGCWVHDIDRDDGGTIHPVTLGAFEVVTDV
jgi:hypothetical protein